MMLDFAYDEGRRVTLVRLAGCSGVSRNLLSRYVIFLLSELSIHGYALKEGVGLIHAKQ